MPDSSLPRNFVVYLITCIPTRMRYVGITTQGLRKRWNHHVNSGLSGRQKTPLHRDIARLGPEQFTIDAIFSAFTLRGLWDSENSLIDQWGTMSPAGYNIHRGGNIAAFTRTPESIERSAAKHRGVPESIANRESLASIAAHYSVSRTAIYKIHKGLKWKSVA